MRTWAAATPTSSHNSRTSACSGVSPSSIPPWGNCQASRTPIRSPTRMLPRGLRKIPATLALYLISVSLMLIRKYALPAAAAFVALVLFLWWRWQPERQVRLHTAHFLKSVERRNWNSMQNFLADDYTDRW